MIVEWKGNLLSEPEVDTSPVEEKKTVRSAAATAWEVEQARLAKTGLERPTRPVLPAVSAESKPIVTIENESNVAPEPVVKAVVENQPPVAETPKPESNGVAKKSIMKSSSSPRRPNQSSGFQRVLAAARIIAPFAQKLLPLLDGNVATAVANVLVQRPPTPQVDTQPLEESLAKVKVSQVELQDRVAEQQTQLSRLATHADKLQQAADNLNSEHFELEQELKTLRKRVAFLARVSLVLFAVVLLANAYLALHNFHLLP
jgi:hypothetical protein